MVKNLGGHTFSDLMTANDSRAMNWDNNRLKITGIVIHHNATTSDENARATWLRGGKVGTSAHYEITPNQIIGCVGENKVAYHAGNYSVNQHSIGLEHVNSTGAPKWEIAEGTYKNSARLIADICKRYGLPVNSSTIKPHKAYYATACPGGIDMNKLIRMAQETAGQKPSEPSKPSGELVIDGWWGNATTKKLQQVLDCTIVDGVISGQIKQADNQNVPSIKWGTGGSNVIKAIQKRLGIPVDGYLGVQTVKGMQRHFGTPVDGVISPKGLMVQAMQRALNQGKF